MKELLKTGLVISFVVAANLFNWFPNLNTDTYYIIGAIALATYLIYKIIEELSQNIKTLSEEEIEEAVAKKVQEELTDFFSFGEGRDRFREIILEIESIKGRE